MTEYECSLETATRVRNAKISAAQSAIEAAWKEYVAAIEDADATRRRGSRMQSSPPNPDNPCAAPAGGPHTPAGG